MTAPFDAHRKYMFRDSDNRWCIQCGCGRQYVSDKPTVVVSMWQEDHEDSL